mgnify:CR=1 FL=1
MTTHPRGQPARAFTLIEIVITVIIIAVLAGLVFAALGPALRTARITGERQALTSIKIGIEHAPQRGQLYTPAWAAPGNAK